MFNSIKPRFTLKNGQESAKSKKGNFMIFLSTIFSKLTKKGKNAVADAVLGDVTCTIQGQKQILKEEMVAVIDRKLNEKIKDQLNEIMELQETINRLKEGNNQVNTADRFWQRMAFTKVSYSWHKKHFRFSMNILSLFL